ncbi:MAG: hypothetical protein KF901_11555 [Myxococcales bacterium]|nr:hypothetical protein [Myxococcales bacterium]
MPAGRVTTQRCLTGVIAGEAPPARLSETDCFETIAPLVPTAELVPFGVASELFTDDTVKRRWMAIPPGEVARIEENGEITMPLGTVLVKLFAEPSDPPAPLEVRFSVSGPEGFVLFTYRVEGDDARLLDGAETTRFTLSDGRDVDYLFPSRDTCATCHRVNPVLGPTAPQLATTVRYEGRAGAQLDALRALGVLEGWFPEGRAMPSPFDTSAPLEARARAYLHANCAHCHTPGGFAPVGLDLDLRWSTPLEETRTVCVPTQFPGTSDMGMRIDPAYPADSVILRRVGATLGEFPGPMPPVGRSVVDVRALPILRAWVESLDASLCP